MKAKDIAKQIGLLPSTYTMLEKGDRKINADEVGPIGKALGVPISELYSTEQKEPSSQVQTGTADRWSEEQIMAAQYLIDNNLLSSAARFARVLSELSDDGLDHLEAFLRELRKQNPKSIPDQPSPRPGEPR